MFYQTFQSQSSDLIFKGSKNMVFLRSSGICICWVSYHIQGVNKLFRQTSGSDSTCQNNGGLSANDSFFKIPDVNFFLKTEDFDLKPVEICK